MNIVKSKTVLIAEDNELNMKLFKDLLEMKDMQVVCVDDGQKVFDAVLEHRPNLILMDIRLNNISGLDIVQQIRSCKDTRHIPIIALTAFAMKADKEKILHSGCDGYMAKPIFIDTFFQEIERFISPK